MKLFRAYATARVRDGDRYFAIKKFVKLGKKFCKLSKNSQM